MKKDDLESTINATDLAAHEPGTPLYLAVRNAIADHISTGRLKPTERLPSERVLCERFGVSRVTLRRSLQDLAEEGLIEASAGRGWFVAEDRLSEPPNALLSFTDLARARGLVPSARVVQCGSRPASIDEAELLGVAPGSSLLEIERVRLLNGLPVALDYSLVAVGNSPELVDCDFETVSLYAVLRERAGVMPTFAESTLEAIAAVGRVAELLELADGEPVLVSRQITYDQNSQRFESGRIYYRGDRYRLRTTLLASPGGEARGSFGLDLTRDC